MAAGDSAGTAESPPAAPAAEPTPAPAPEPASTAAEPAEESKPAPAESKPAPAESTPAPAPEPAESKPAPAESIPAPAAEPAAEGKPAAADAPKPDAPKEAPKETSQSLDVLESLIGWLVGPGASGVMELERLSGSRIEVSREPAVDGKKKVVVRGSEVQVARGRVLLEDKLRGAPAPSAAEGGAAAETTLAVAAPEANIMLAGHRFVDRSDLLDYIRKLQSSIPDNKMVGPEDAFFLFHLITHHPNFQEKMISPVVGFKYGEHELFPGSKCFFVVRADGTQEGISVMKALDVIAPKGRGAKRPREEEPASSAPSRGDEEGAIAEPPAKRLREITVGCILEIDGVPSNLVYEDLREELMCYSHFKFLELLNPRKEKGAKPAKADIKALVDGETAMKVDSTSAPAEAPAKAEGVAVNGDTAAKVENSEKPAEVPVKVESAAADGETAMKVDSTDKPAEVPAKAEGAAEEVKTEIKAEVTTEAKSEPKEEVKEEMKEEVKEEVKEAPVAAAPVAAPVAAAANADEEEGDEDEDESEEEEEVVMLKARARFASAESASKAAAELKELKGKPVSVRILEGEEERNFWERLWEKADQKQKQQDGKGKKGKGKDGKGKGKKGKGKKGKGKGKGKKDR